MPKLLINLGAGHISIKHGFMVRCLLDCKMSLAHYHRARIMRQQLLVRLALILSATQPGSLHAAMQT